MNNSWHLKLFKKSICKQNKLKAIQEYLQVKQEGHYLDVGGDNGVISYYLRQLGGNWISADLEDTAVEAIKALVGKSVYKINGCQLPFDDNSFDGIVIIDFLEHIEKDKEFINELSRITREEGFLIINVPYLKRFSLLSWLREQIGLGAASHGHVRAGYAVRDLEALLGDRFKVIACRTYSRVFTELIDTLIALVNKLTGSKTTQKGLLVTEKDLRKKAKVFKVYSVLYPLFWLFAKLDYLVFFTKGFSLIVKTEKS